MFFGGPSFWGKKYFLVFLVSRFVAMTSYIKINFSCHCFCLKNIKKQHWLAG